MGEVKPTPEQVKAIDAILAENREAARAARSGLSPEERRSLGASMRRETSAKIAQALDPERRSKFEEMTREARAARGGGGTPGRVYLLDDKGEPRPVSVRTGVSDGSVSEIVSGDVPEGARIIIGGGPKTAPATPASARGPRLF